MSTKACIILGAGGFIGGHLCQRLVRDGHDVTGVDLKHHEFMGLDGVKFIQGDLRDPDFVDDLALGQYDEVYQLAAWMGGALFCFSGDNDADIMHNSGLINLNVVRNICDIPDYAEWEQKPKIFYSSSACIYPEHNQLDPDNPNCAEDSAYPAAPDSEYGWEKLFSERMYMSFARNYGLDVRIARYHNIFGPRGTWRGGREKAPAAICRKVAEAEDGGVIEVWGDGRQTRSFLYVDECVEATLRLIVQRAREYRVGRDDFH
jgi:nucleoside-diphosphate-sugar epimerase